MLNEERAGKQGRTSIKRSGEAAVSSRKSSSEGREVLNEHSSWYGYGEAQLVVHHQRRRFGCSMCSCGSSIGSTMGMGSSMGSSMDPHGHQIRRPIGVLHLNWFLYGLSSALNSALNGFLNGSPWAPISTEFCPQLAPQWVPMNTKSANLRCVGGSEEQILCNCHHFDLPNKHGNRVLSIRRTSSL